MIFLHRHTNQWDIHSSFIGTSGHEAERNQKSQNLFEYSMRESERYNTDNEH